MSTLKVTNIQDTGGGNSSTSAEIYSGRAKAWVNFNGTGTVAIRDDFNVNTIGDNGLGDYTVNFSTALPDTDYVWALNERNEDNSPSSQTFSCPAANCETPSSSSFRFSLITPVNNLKHDGKYAVAVFFR
jgi:hypothetical protein